MGEVGASPCSTRNRPVACRRLASLAAAALALSACTAPEPSTVSEPLPITVEVNQSRDQYGKQAIQLLLTNVSGGPLTIAAAQLTSPLFHGDILWEPTGGSFELLPGQPTSLPARLPAAACGDVVRSSGEQPVATVRYSAPGEVDVRVVRPLADDPFGVLERNNRELCLAADAAAVAAIVLNPRLEVAPDSRTAVIRLVITPRNPPGTKPGPTACSLTITNINGTTLLAEPNNEPWPRNIQVRQGDPPTEIPLPIRPARCDPHAVAEDKVGTLLPLRVRVRGQEGLLKIPAGTALRGQIYDFVTAACTQE